MSASVTYRWVMRRWPAGLLRLYVAAMCVWLVAPIVIVVILAFSGDGYLRFPPASLASSLIIGAIACITSTTIGFFAAYAFLRSEFRGKKLLLSLMLTPVIVPSIITAIAMYYLAGKLGLIGNFLWLGLCHAVIAMPVVLLILLSALHAVDPDLERAALGLGASRLRVFCRVVLPIALPGVLSAALFAFLASFDELLISLFLAGVHAQTLPVRIWNSLNLQVEPTIAAVSAFLIAVTTLILAIEAVLRPRIGQRRGRTMP